MEHQSINNLNFIKNEVESSRQNVKIIAVSKTFPINIIKPLINYGHIHFGENKVQEASEKWSLEKKKNNKIKLHLIGKLQSNKVKYCLPLFDYIHSLDNLKLAEKISHFQTKVNFKPKIFIQVNIGDEDQKNGIAVKNLKNFVEECRNNLDLDIIGLMCIPPINKNPLAFFNKMKQLNQKYSLKELSMGMSSDYLEAINCGATYVRIGSKIFGQRS